MAIELSTTKWRLAFGGGTKKRQAVIAAGDFATPCAQFVSSDGKRQKLFYPVQPGEMAQVWRRMDNGEPPAAGSSHPGQQEREQGRIVFSDTFQVHYRDPLQQVHAHLEQIPCQIGSDTPGNAKNLAYRLDPERTTAGTSSCFFPHQSLPAAEAFLAASASIKPSIPFARIWLANEVR